MRALLKAAEICGAKASLAGTCPKMIPRYLVCSLMGIPSAASFSDWVGDQVPLGIIQDLSKLMQRPEKIAKRFRAFKLEAIALTDFPGRKSVKKSRSSA